MISKKLLSTVLEIPLDSIGDIHYKDSHVIYGVFTINVYQLMHKCKEWALIKDYQLSSSKPIVQDDEGKQVFNYWWIASLFVFDGGYDSPKQVLSSFIGNTEPEAVFKACQWILEEVKDGLV
ncbi:MAG: hypothetical protein KAI79_18015 [Bacteroidales bacterium]|nr:hypothetical protein [Bacteroidales bacterium]